MALTECWGLAGSALASPLPFSAAITIGRDIDCDLKLADKQVSRKHARIEQREDGYWITDLGSSNGVFVNEKRISGAIRLTPGNQIRIGDTRLEVVAQAPSFEGVLPAKEGTPVRQSPAPSPTDQPAVGQVLSTNICPQCKQPIHAGARFCRYCGARLAA
jgi:pSer/pThr/pTyr-binding forkhead associated (FHA) protein